MRDLDAAVIAALDDPFVKPVYFAQIQFDDATLYLHDDLGSIDFDSNTYLGVGAFGSVSGIEEREDGSPVGVTLTLSAIDQGILDEVLTEDYFGRIAIVYIALRDVTTGALLADPTEVVYGTIDTMTINQSGGNSSIEVVVASELELWDRPLNRLFSDAENQRLYPGKLGARYMADMVNRKITLANGTVTSIAESLEAIRAA